MTSMQAKIHRVWPLIAIVALLAGCATAPPPLTELADARAEVDRARAAGADASAPVELRFAEDKLSAAQAASEKRDYAVAGSLATQARVDAELASAKARAARARSAVREKTDDNARLRRELLTEEGAP